MRGVGVEKDEEIVYMLFSTSLPRIKKSSETNRLFENIPIRQIYNTCKYIIHVDNDNDFTTRPILYIIG